MAYLEGEKLHVKAHGEINKCLKMFLYSYDIDNNIYILTELNIDYSKMDVNYQIKFDDMRVIQKYEEYLLTVIDPLIN